MPDPPAVSRRLRAHGLRYLSSKSGISCRGRFVNHLAAGIERVEVYSVGNVLSEEEMKAWTVVHFVDNRFPVETP